MINWLTDITIGAIGYDFTIGFGGFILAFGVIYLTFKTIHWQIHGKKIYNKLPKNKQTPLRRGSWFWFWIWVGLMLMLFSMVISSPS